MFQKRPSHEEAIDILNYIQLRLIQKIQTEETIKAIEACDLLLSHLTAKENRLN